VATLGEKQRRLPIMLASLWQWAYEKGYEISLGEAYRTDEQAEIHALGDVNRGRLADLLSTLPQFEALAAKIRNNTGDGSRTSLHCDRLAIDINLFINGELQKQTEAYRPLGEEWERLGGTWGGRFNDGGHFSIAHEGRA
jgi:hypothetical protein